MHRLYFAVSISLLAVGAFGDAASASVARQRHVLVSEQSTQSDKVSPDEFCRGNADIEVSTYCAPYRD